jgi:tRNA pseudouridine38-40 synthase
LRFFLEIAYRGTQYHGWQRQPNAETVQQVVEASMSILLNEAVSIMGAGRTDTGVHAKQMYAHFDTNYKFDDASDFVFRMNAMLPKDIVIKKLFQVSDSAHSRFDAIYRTYEYWVYESKNPFLEPFAYRLKSNVDFDIMNQAADLLLHHQDFKCFSKSNTDVSTFECNITKANWKSHNEYSVFTITANRFLRNMVRAVVGTLLEIGQGKHPVTHLQEVLESQDRSSAGFSVPAHGLYLTEVGYPNELIKTHG